MNKSHDPLIQKIGKYVVTDVIGSGGMGIVYRAHDATLNRTVAIKMLKRESAGGRIAQLEQFFSRELRATASLQHKNIVTVYESGEQDGNPYLVMECLDGEPVSRIIADRRAMPIVDKLDLFVQVCDGLQHAHDRKPQIIHRDIKPANVILAKDGTVKIVDFGIARVVGIETSTLQAGQLLGSLSYLSPEQINAGPIDSRTDIFSSGVMLYELLTYSLPFKGNDPGTVFAKILREEPAPLSGYLSDVPPELQGCVSKALAKKTHDRYQTAEELGFDLLKIQKKLKQGMADDFMLRAESAMRRGDLERVKLHLQEILRLDRHHDRANRLLAEVRKAIQEKQRAAQIAQMRSQAQVALAGQQYEEALACAEQALQLDPGDAYSVALREEIQNAISLGEAARDSLRRAETALYAGDLDEARDVVDAALRYDPNGAEARALAAIIDKELAERSRRLLVRGLVDSARQGIAERHFGDAIESLRKAEQLDASDSNVRELLEWANRGQEQERRRKDLLEITDQIHEALRAEDFSSAFTICEVGLASFSNEPTLQRLKSIAEKQRDITAKRRFVHDQSLAAKKLLEQGEFGASIKMLEAALNKFPAEPNLEAQLSLARIEAAQESKNRESLAAKEAYERAQFQNIQKAQQQVDEQAATLRKALDERAEIGHLEELAYQLGQMLMGIAFHDQTRKFFDPIFEEVRARQQLRDQVSAELQGLRVAVDNSFDGGLGTRARARLEEVKAEFPHERNVQDTCEEVASILEARRDEHERVLAELTKTAESVRKVSLSESTELLQRSTQISARFLLEPQVGALLQQIEHEVNRRLAQRQVLIGEMEQLESASSEARSLEGLSQLLKRAQAIASANAEDGEIAAALDGVKTAADSREQVISRLMTEVQQVTENALTAQSIEEAEQLLADAQRRAAAHPELDGLQEITVRASAQVHGRRVEHDLICEELGSLSASMSQAFGAPELDLIRQRADQIRNSHSADKAIIALCRQIEVDFRSARAKLLQIELNRLSEEQDAKSWKSQPPEIASHIRKLQELVKSFPESEEARAMLLRAEESLERLERARYEAEARASAIELEIKACTRLFESKQSAKALSAIEEAAAKYPESESLQSLLLKCRERIAAEQEAQRQASERRAALQAAIGKGTDLLRSRRFEEAADLLEVACTQWPDEKQLRELLSAARKSANRQALIGEMEQLESASSEARSLEGLSQLLKRAQAIASANAEDGEIAAALDGVKTAADSRGQVISRLMTEAHQVAESALTAARERVERVAEAQRLRGGGEFGRALELVEAALQSSPDDRELEVLKLQIESDQAKQQRKEAIADATEEAQRHLRDGQIALAIEVLQRSAARFPDDEVVSKLLRVAEERLRKETELNSVRVRAEALLGEGQEEEAVVLLENRMPNEPAFKELLATAHTALNTKRREGLLSQAVVLQRQARYGDAQGLVQQAIRQYGSNPAAADLERTLQDQIEIERRRQSHDADRDKLLAIEQQVPTTRQSKLKKLAVSAQQIAAAYTAEDEVAAIALRIRQRIESQLSATAPPKPIPVRQIAAGVAVILVVLVGIVAIPRLLRVTTVPVEIRTDPPGASVSIGDKSCVTPNCRLELAPAQYRIEAQLTGYEQAERSLTVDSHKQPAPINLTMQPLNSAASAPPPPSGPKPAPLGTLVVQAGVPDALVSVDRTLRGRTDGRGSLSLPLEAKSYQVRVEKPGYRTPRDQQVDIASGASQRLTFSLDPLRAEAISEPSATVESHANSLSPVPAAQEPPKLPPAPTPAVTLNTEAQDWNRVSATSDPAQIEDYLKKYPSGAHKAEAESRLPDLVWGQINQNDAVALQGYLNRFPKSPHARDAARQIDDLLWTKLNKSNSQILRDFVAGNPNSTHRNEAISILDKMDLREAETQGIQAALDKFNAAFKNQKARELKEIWPSAEEKYLSALPGRAGYKLVFVLRPTGEPEINGDKAVIQCDVSSTTTKPGEQPTTTKNTFNVQLYKKGSWLISDPFRQ